jgi:hypothetical protein
MFKSKKFKSNHQPPNDGWFLPRLKTAVGSSRRLKRRLEVKFGG